MNHTGLRFDWFLISLVSIELNELLAELVVLDEDDDDSRLFCCCFSTGNLVKICRKDSFAVGFS